MLNSRVYFILPKYSSYEFAEDSKKIWIREQVLNKYNYLSLYTNKITCLHEDMLAVEILSECTSVTWVEALSEGDLNFLKSGVDSYPKKFWDIKANQLKNKKIEEAKKKYPVVTLRQLNGDVESYNLERFNTLIERLKYVANDIVNTAEVIVYFYNNNNYCKRVKPSESDGRLIFDCDLRNGVESVYFGGRPIEGKYREMIVRSVFNVQDV
jgi:hypothetical protein